MHLPTSERPPYAKQWTGSESQGKGLFATPIYFVVDVDCLGVAVR